MTNQQTQCVIERRKAVRFGNDSCIRQHSLGVFLFLFPFFLTGPENGAVEYSTSDTTRGSPAPYAPPGVRRVGWKRESRSGTA